MKRIFSLILSMAIPLMIHAGTTTYEYDTRGRLTGMALEEGASHNDKRFYAVSKKHSCYRHMATAPETHWSRSL